jgi:hypothetical protein
MVPLAARCLLAHPPPLPTLCPSLQDKLLDRAPGAAFGGYHGGRREAGLLAAACEAYAGGYAVQCPNCCAGPSTAHAIVAAIPAWLFP